MKYFLLLFFFCWTSIASPVFALPHRVVVPSENKTTEKIENEKSKNFFQRIKEKIKERKQIRAKQKSLIKSIKKELRKDKKATRKEKIRKFLKIFLWATLGFIVGMFGFLHTVWYENTFLGGSDIFSGLMAGLFIGSFYVALGALLAILIIKISSIFKKD